MNFSQSTTENKSAYGWSLSEGRRGGKKYIWFAKKYIVITGFKLCRTFSIT